MRTVHLDVRIMRGLSAKYLGMSSCFHERQRQNVVFNQIDQKPVGFDVTLPKPLKLTRKSVVVVFFVEWFALPKRVNHTVQKRKINFALFHLAVATLVC